MQEGRWQGGMRERLAAWNGAPRPRTTTPQDYAAARRAWKTVTVTERLKARTTNLLARDMAMEHAMQKRQERAITVARESCLLRLRKSRLSGSKITPVMLDCRNIEGGGAG